MIYRAHKIRLYPNKEQETLLAKTAGTARFAYNWGIDFCETAYKNKEKHPSGYDLRKQWIKDHPEWANEVAASCLYQSILNVAVSYRRFFDKKSNHPKYHKKGIHDSFYIASDKASIANKKIRLPKIGYVKMAEELRYNDCRINSYTIRKKAGVWYAVVQVVVPEDTRTISSTVVGVDVGIKNWAIASDGTTCESPSRLRHLERILRRKQRLLARKCKGSNRREKAKMVVSKAYNKIHNVKLDTIHKFTSAISKNHGVVVVEDLSVKDMQTADNKYIRKGVHNSMMSEIIRQLTYKCNSFIKVDRYYASSKTCSNCGNVKQNLTLSDRDYKCAVCGFHSDRDLNAALNLRNKGLEFIYGRSDR